MRRIRLSREFMFNSCSTSLCGVVSSTNNNTRHTSEKRFAWRIYKLKAHLCLDVVEYRWKPIEHFHFFDFLKELSRCIYLKGGLVLINLIDGGYCKVSLTMLK